MEEQNSLFEKTDEYTEESGLIESTEKFTQANNFQRHSLVSHVSKVSKVLKFSAIQRFTKNLQFSVLPQSELIDDYSPLLPLPKIPYLLDSGGGYLLQGNGFRIIL